MEEEFVLERHLLNELAIVFADVSGRPVMHLELGTALVNLGINSLSFLEAIEIMSQKYDIRITHEELAGSLIVGRIEKIIEEKVFHKHSGNIEKIKEIALQRQLNLVGENLTKVPGPLAIKLAENAAKRGSQ